MLSEARNSEPNQPLAGWRLLALAEFITAILLLEIAIWTLDPQARIVAGVLAGCMIFRCFFAYGRLPQFQSSRLIHDLVLVVFISVTISLLAALACYWLDIWVPVYRPYEQRTIMDWWTVKIPTVVLQQILFQLVFIPTLYYLTGRRLLTVLLSALAFGLLHLPNPLLMLVTFLVGLCWFYFTVHQTRIVALTVSHLVLAVAIANFAEDYIFDMRVGQVCFQKWPEWVEGETDRNVLIVYPRRVDGEISSVTQSLQSVSIRGFVYDQTRQKPPSKVHLVFGSFDPEDHASKDWRPQKIRTVNVANSKGDFEVILDSQDFAGQSEVRVFASHGLGWTYPVLGSARLNIAKRELSGETVCLFPKQTRGYIGHVRKRRVGTDLIGWGFERKGRKSFDNFLILHNKELVQLPLQPRRRPQIADFFGDERLLDCGFISNLPFNLPQGLPSVYVRNSAGQLERIPFDLNNPANQRMANLEPQYQSETTLLR